MEIKSIRLTDLEQNKGQVPGLPSNPREWGRKELDDLVKSIRETPELLEARGLIVWPYEGKYIILGGNMRFSALREMNEVDAPCYVMPEDTPTEKLREIVIKDNGAFGSWDYDMLANEWDDLPLPEWGVPAWNTTEIEDISDTEVDVNDLSDEFELPTGEKSPYRGITFNVTDEQAEFIYQSISIAIRKTNEYDEENEENENTNTIALLYIVQYFIDSLLSSYGTKKEDIIKGLKRQKTESEKKTDALREYLCEALKESGKTASDVDKFLGTTGMSGHYFGRSQWMFPTKEVYEKLKEIMHLPKDFAQCKEVCKEVCKEAYILNKLQKIVDNYE